MPTLLLCLIVPGCSLLVDNELEKKPPRDPITGEGGSSGPFTIGEQIRIRLSSDNREMVHRVLIGPTTEVDAPCPGKLEGDVFVCTISPLTLEGKKLGFTAVTQKMNQVEIGSIAVRRQVAAGAPGADTIVLFDAATLEVVKSITVPGKLTVNQRPRISPAGRWLLFSHDDPANSYRPTLALLDLVTHEVAPLDIVDSSVDRCSFEPEFDSMSPWWFIPSRRLWVVDAKDDLRAVILPILPKTINRKIRLNIGTARRAKVSRVRWSPLFRTGAAPTKQMAGLSKDGLTAFVFNPAGAGSFADVAVPPKGTARDLAFIRQPGATPTSALVVLGKESGVSLLHHYTITGGAPALRASLRLEAGAQALDPVALVGIQGTPLVGMTFTSYPLKVLSFTHLSAVSNSLTVKQAPLAVMSARPLRILPTRLFSRRMLVRSDTAVSVYSDDPKDAGINQLVLKPFVVNSLIAVKHHPVLPLIYTLSPTVLTSHSYAGQVQTQVHSAAISPAMSQGWIDVQP